MKPVEFPGVNVVFAKDQPGYMSLPAMKIPNDPQGLIIRWETLTGRKAVQIG